MFVKIINGRTILALKKKKIPKKIIIIWEITRGVPVKPSVYDDRAIRASL